MKQLALGLAAALTLAATAAPVAAQSVPSGSYQQSCTNVRVRGNQLTARCNTSQGGTVRSRIDLGSCRGGDISNSNGQLTCNTNGSAYGTGHRHRHNAYGGNGNGYGRTYGNGNGYGYGNGNGYGGGYGNGRFAAAPGGSYQQSCTGARMRGTMLSATCPTGNGSSNTSTIDVSQCRGADITNRNGRLSCG